MKRWHTYNRRKKRHVSKELWRFTELLKDFSKSIQQVDWSRVIAKRINWR